MTKPVLSALPILPCIFNTIASTVGVLFLYGFMKENDCLRFFSFVPLLNFEKDGNSTGGGVFINELLLLETVDVLLEIEEDTLLLNEPNDELLDIDLEDTLLLTELGDKLLLNEEPE